MDNIIENMRGMLGFTSGCTEPGAIALNASHAGRGLTGEADEIILEIDGLTYNPTLTLRSADFIIKKHLTVS